MSVGFNPSPLPGKGRFRRSFRLLGPESGCSVAVASMLRLPGEQEKRPARKRLKDVGFLQQPARGTNEPGDVKR
jgi:hypothetical protein